MGDPRIHQTIEQLVAEKHELWARESAAIARDADGQRLQELKVSLASAGTCCASAGPCGKPGATRTTPASGGPTSSSTTSSSRSTPP